MKATDNFQEIEHTADWALLVRGNTLLDLFVNAAIGMYTLTVDAPQVLAQVERSIEVSGIDAETLLINWLNELLYATEVDGLVFGQFAMVEFGPNRLRAVARGQVGLPLRKHIKAATFHNLRVAPTDNGYEVVIVFDV